MEKFGIDKTHRLNIAFKPNFVISKFFDVPSMEMF